MMITNVETYVRNENAKMTSSYHVASERNQKLLEDYFKDKVRNLIASKKNNSLFVLGWDIKICPSGSEILMTDFSILPSHS